MNKVIDLELLNRPIDAINNERYNAYFESYLSNNINTRISLNGLWKFIYLDKFHSEIDNKYLDKDYDYIIDCCDTVTTKLALVLFAKENNIKIISSCGTGNRLNPTKLIITDIYKTKNDPLAKVLRNLLRKNNIDSLKVITSEELPIKSQDYISSVSFVPNTAGIYLAYTIFDDIIKKIKLY